jgi:uncharacterized membrane protein
VALLFWWWSLDPSMLPRGQYAQGAVRGLSAAIGYLLGTLASWAAVVPPAEWTVADSTALQRHLPAE